jgi:hypothetical protein
MLTFAATISPLIFKIYKEFCSYIQTKHTHAHARTFTHTHTLSLSLSLSLSLCNVLICLNTSFKETNSISRSYSNNIQTAQLLVLTCDNFGISKTTLSYRCRQYYIPNYIGHTITKKKQLYFIILYIS